MINQQLIDSFLKIKLYCEAEHYKGWDPYDGLNSKVFQALPFLKNSALCRLAVIQGFKRCPVNLRWIAAVPKEHNAKGIGLFLQGYCNLVKAVRKNPALAASIGTEEVLMGKVKEVAALLISLGSDGPSTPSTGSGAGPSTGSGADYHGACWGYNFDWQARGGLFFPAYTPTVVATNFCATALMEAYEVTKEKSYLDLSLTSAEFVMQDLHRYDAGGGGFLFSYSKLPGNDTVYNASLLGSRLLSYCYKYTGHEEYRQLAEESVKACCNGQREDGAWRYGLHPGQTWVDSFHTGYNLDGLIAYEENTGDTKYHDYIEKGFEYYIEHFFEQDGTPKYYDNQMYPIDIHCPGQLFVTLSRLHKFAEYKDLAERVLGWTMQNMQDKKGYFYYQLKKGVSSKISYMRWSNAFMFCALSYYMLESNTVNNVSLKSATNNHGD